MNCKYCSKEIANYIIYEEDDLTPSKETLCMHKPTKTLIAPHIYCSAMSWNKAEPEERK